MADTTTGTPGLYGLAARFAEPTELVHATEEARDAGYRSFEAYTPYPVPGAWEATGHKTPMSLITLIGGLVGMTGSFAFFTWVNLVAYPLNVGGRPLFAWPAFIPPTFESTILLAGLAAGIGMLLINGLPHPYHPVFNIPQFERASIDRYFMVIEATDAKFDRAATESFLRGLGAEEVSEVEH